MNEPKMAQVAASKSSN